MPPEKKHLVYERRSPVDITVYCTCGWSRTETRRQNAFRRATRLRAAVRKHLEEKGEFE